MMEPDWDAAARLILSFEAFYGFVYDDYYSPARRWSPGTPVRGTLTVAYGETDPAYIRWVLSLGRDLTEPEGRARYQQRVPGYWRGISRHITVETNPNQGAALTSFGYNTGPDGIAREIPRELHTVLPAEQLRARYGLPDWSDPDTRYALPLLRAINERRFVDAAEIWKTSIIMRGSVWEQGLRRRRAAESALFAKPWTPPADSDPYHRKGRTMVWTR